MFFSVDCHLFMWIKNTFSKSKYSISHLFLSHCFPPSSFTYILWGVCVKACMSSWVDVDSNKIGCVFLKIWLAACLAPSVRCPTLDFSSGHDLTVHEIEPHVRLCAGSTEPTWDSLSLSLSVSFSLSLSPLLTHSFSLKINKFQKIKKMVIIFINFIPSSF